MAVLQRAHALMEKPYFARGNQGVVNRVEVFQANSANDIHFYFSELRFEMLYVSLSWH